jgi:hypothetical protein
VFQGWLLPPSDICQTTWCNISEDHHLHTCFNVRTWNLTTSCTSHMCNIPIHTTVPSVLSDSLERFVPSDLVQCYSFRFFFLIHFLILCRTFILPWINKTLEPCSFALFPNKLQVHKSLSSAVKDMFIHEHTLETSWYHTPFALFLLHNFVLHCISQMWKQNLSSLEYIIGWDLSLCSDQLLGSFSIVSDRIKESECETDHLTRTVPGYFDFMAC